MKYYTVEVTTRPNSTIEALIRFYNRFSMSREQLDFVMQEFNNLNPDAKPPRPNQKVIMPILTDYCEKIPLS